MKQMVATVLLIFLLFGGIQCLYSEASRQIHQEELELALERAMRHSLTAACIEKDYPIDSEEEFYADFLGDFMLMLSAEAEYEITIHELDLKNGIMNLEVESFFTLPGGRSESVTCHKYAVVREW